MKRIAPGLLCEIIFARVAPIALGRTGKLDVKKHSLGLSTAALKTARQTIAQANEGGT